MERDRGHTVSGVTEIDPRLLAQLFRVAVWKSGNV